jgi:hypothetical protein
MTAIKSAKRYDLNPEQLEVILDYMQGEQSAGQSAKLLNIHRQSFTQLVCSVIPQLVKEGIVKL